MTVVYYVTSSTFRTQRKKSIYLSRVWSGLSEYEIMKAPRTVFRDSKQSLNGKF